MKKHIYFVYKFQVTGTGYFYIGVTNNIERRKSQHASTINSLVFKLRYKRGGSIKTRSKGHLIVARSIVKGKRFLAIAGCFSSSKCKMIVLDIKDTPKEAMMMEQDLLNKYHKYKKCFNTDHKSRYNPYYLHAV